MNNQKKMTRNPDTEIIEKALVEKYGAEEYAKARARAKFKAELAHIMKQRRIELDMDQKELAVKLHTTQQQLSRYEVGENSPTIERVYDICQMLNLELIVREKDKGTVLVCI